jgi:hypothetical protein
MKKQIRTPTEKTKIDKVDNIKENLIAALETSLGIVSTACKKVNISRETFYNYRESDPIFAKRVDDIRYLCLDFVESKLFKLVNDENPAAIMFFLKCKGKDRGYTEKQSIEISGSITAQRTPLQFFETPEDDED